MDRSQGSDEGIDACREDLGPQTTISEAEDDLRVLLPSADGGMVDDDDYDYDCDYDDDNEEEVDYGNAIEDMEEAFDAATEVLSPEEQEELYDGLGNADEENDGTSEAVETYELENLTAMGFLRLLQTGFGNGTMVPAFNSNSRAQPGLEEPEPSGNSMSSGSWWKKPHTQPQPAGVKLLLSGEFGRTQLKFAGQASWKSNIAHLIRERMSVPGRMPIEDLGGSLVPNSAGSIVAQYPSPVYCGQFSADSSFYYVCCKDFMLHIYDMIGPRKWDNKPEHDSSRHHLSTMKVQKSIHGLAQGWTITDSHLSPDNNRMIYSSMSATVYMVTTREFDDRTQIPLNFSDDRPSHHLPHWGWGDDLVIWSCRFSADGNEVIAGGRGTIYVYDLLANRRTVKIRAHEDDVNSCCWADSGSNVLISASDDTFIKVWDRRTLGSMPKPSGVLIGHTEGITYVSAKGDGRYVISNGKDQALRLWDLRMMRSNKEYEAVKNQQYGLPNFDYRYHDPRRQRRPAHPQDCSVMTYRGHTVMRTLIRCHFSPTESTGGQYIYSGSQDGRIHIWSLDGRVVQVLDRFKTLAMSFDPSEPERPYLSNNLSRYDLIVRDVSWSTREPVLLSAAWHSHGESSVARHEWKGLSKMNMRLEDWVEKQRAEHSERPSLGIYEGRTRSSASRLYARDDDDNDDEYAPSESDDED